MVNARLQRAKAVVAHQLGPADDAAKTPPLGVVAHRDHAPAILALAAINAVGRSQGVMIALGFGVVTVHRSFQIGRAQHRRRAFDLRQVDGHAFAAAPTIQ